MERAVKRGAEIAKRQAQDKALDVCRKLVAWRSIPDRTDETNYFGPKGLFAVETEAANVLELMGEDVSALRARHAEQISQHNERVRLSIEKLQSRLLPEETE